MMDRLFAQSGLMREKWNRGDYREHSLELAISGTSEFFKPLRVDTAQEDFESNKLVSTLEDLDAIHNPRFSDQDIGAGRLFADVFRDKARFIPERKKWAVYDGKRWVATLFLWFGDTCPDCMIVKTVGRVGRSAEEIGAAVERLYALSEELIASGCANWDTLWKRKGKV